MRGTTLTSFCGSSCANNGKVALNIPDSSCRIERSLVSPQARTDTSVELVDGVFAEEILVTERMFSDHSPTSYLRAFQAVGFEDPADDQH
eukprot:9468430-Pyramimonas_sp.AAC.1